MLRVRWLLTALTVFTALFAVLPNASAQDGTYRLQIEDVLGIQIYNENQVGAQVQVGQDGNVSAPFLGLIKAAGRTVEELSAELTQAYIQKLRLRDPKVSVIIVRFRELRATVIGMVGKPGSWPVRKGDSIVTLLGLAGGIIPDRANPYRAMLRRAKSQEQIPVDLYAILYRGDTTQNYPIEDGDELYVPEDNRNQLSLMGTIARPGTYPYRDGMRLTDALSLGLGEIPRKTMLSKVRVFRQIAGQPEQYRVLGADLVKFFNNGDFAQNLVLQPGDIVYFNKTKTPDLSEIGSVVNSLWISNVLLKNGLFGAKF